MQKYKNNVVFYKRLKGRRLRDKTTDSIVSFVDGVSTTFLVFSGRELLNLRTMASRDSPTQSGQYHRPRGTFSRGGFKHLK